MRRLAELIGDLASAPHADARLKRLADYFGEEKDGLGWAAAWLTAELKPPRQTPAKMRMLAEGRVDAELFRLSAAAFGDVGETAALIWPGGGDAPISEIARTTAPLPDLLDRLDAEARVALVRLHCGRKPKGVKAREVHMALGQVFGADPALIAGAMIEEAPPYPRLCAWLAKDGPAPNWAPPRPPEMPCLTAAPDKPFAAWVMPDGDPVAIERGRAFDAEGGERKISNPPSEGWGFLSGDQVADPSRIQPLTTPHEAHEAGQTLLVRLEGSGEWAVWPAVSRSVICPVTFIETGRSVAVTLGVKVGEDVAPLAKLPAPEAAKVSAFARKAVIDKFGPVRQVGPGLWAEISYEAVRPAPRRKIGVTLQGAAIIRLIWTDGPATPALSEIK